MRKVYWDENANPIGTHLANIIYELRSEDDGDDLILDAVCLADFEETAESVMYDALVTEYRLLERKMNVMRRVMNRVSADLKVREDNGPDDMGIIISKPFKRNGTSNVAALFQLTDGQTISILFHNPDTTPNRVLPTDELISWKWMVNKKDVTIVVAPEKGQDLNVNEVARRIMRIAEKNSARFQAANAKRAERIANIENQKAEIGNLEQSLTGIKSDCEAAELQYNDALESLENLKKERDKAIQAAQVRAEERIMREAKQHDTQEQKVEDLPPPVTAVPQDPEQWQRWPLRTAKDIVDFTDKIDFWSNPAAEGSKGQRLERALYNGWKTFSGKNDDGSWFTVSFVGDIDSGNGKWEFKNTSYDDESPSEFLDPVIACFKKAYENGSLVSGEPPVEETPQNVEANDQPKEKRKRFKLSEIIPMGRLWEKGGKVRTYFNREIDDVLELIGFEIKTTVNGKLKSVTDPDGDSISNNKFFKLRFSLFDCYYDHVARQFKTRFGSIDLNEKFEKWGITFEDDLPKRDENGDLVEEESQATEVESETNSESVGEVVELDNLVGGDPENILRRVFDNNAGDDLIKKNADLFFALTRGQKAKTLSAIRSVNGDVQNVVIKLAYGDELSKQATATISWDPAKADGVPTNGFSVRLKWNRGELSIKNITNEAIHDIGNELGMTGTDYPWEELWSIKNIDQLSSFADYFIEKDRLDYDDQWDKHKRYGIEEYATRAMLQLGLESYRWGDSDIDVTFYDNGKWYTEGPLDGRVELPVKWVVRNFKDIDYVKKNLTRVPKPSKAFSADDPTQSQTWSQWAYDVAYLATLIKGTADMGDRKTHSTKLREIYGRVKDDAEKMAVLKQAMKAWEAYALGKASAFKG